MLAQMVANEATAFNAFTRTGSRRAVIRRTILIVLVGPFLAGCATTVPLLVADPASPGAKVAQVGYRSTIAPYVSLRPTSPVGWREQNQRVVPTPKNEQ